MNGHSKTNERGVVWLNGELTDFVSAKVSLEDRGFEFGDGVYEVVRVYGGTPFVLSEHLARLEYSAQGIELQLPMSAKEFTTLAHDLLQRSNLSEAEIYIQVTRGTSRRNHLFPQRAAPTVVMGVRAPTEVSIALHQDGCAIITHPDERWSKCNLKTIGLLPNVLAKEHACRAGALEAVMIRDGLVTEGSTSNVFMCREDQLVTPIADNRILSGITRALTIDLAHQIGYQVIERDIKTEELFSVQEVFITSTNVELMPVVKINGQIIGDGRPGDMLTRLRSTYRRRIGEK